MNDELGALVSRLEVSRSDYLVLAWVRALTALLSLGCAVLLLLSNVPIAVFLAALLGLLMSLVWLRQAKRAARTGQRTDQHYLAIHERGFVVVEEQKVTRVLFVDVRSIEQDDERLDIVVQLRDGALVRVEPRYPGLAIHELVAKLQRAAQLGHAATN